MCGQSKNAQHVHHTPVHQENWAKKQVLWCELLCNGPMKMPVHCLACAGCLHGAGRLNE